MRKLPEGRVTNCQWTLRLRNLPEYFRRDNPTIECEDYGFLCDVFVLCHHPIEDRHVADYRNLDQWDFYVVPAGKNYNHYPLVIPDEAPRKSKSYTAVPATLRKGIRRRLPIEPVKYAGLTEAYVRERLKTLCRKTA